MTPTTETENEVKVLRTERGLFDLDSMSNVLLYKEIQFEPVTSSQEALARLGNDAKQFLAVINEGLQSHAKTTARGDASIPWMCENDEGETVVFEGTPADDKAVNALVLNLAKTVFGYTKDSEPDAKRAAKQSALDMIKNNEQIVAGLKKNAAL